MLNFAKIRAAAAATPGDVVGLTKGQLDELLNAAEAGQRARRGRKIVGALVGMVGAPA